MLALANEFETCQGLWEIASERAVLIEVADSPLATRIHLSVGQRIPARIGAMGRCIAARQHLGREDLRRNIEELRWQSPPALDDYARSVARSEEHTSELQSLMRISYAGFCLQKKKT